MTGNTLCPVCEHNWAQRGDVLCYECRMAVPDPDAFQEGDEL